MVNLSEFLTGIANAIRAKKGTTDPIPAMNFATEIASIEGGGGGGEVIEPVLVPLEVTENGVYVPDTGIDGYSQVTVDVPPVVLERGIVVNAADANGNWTDITICGDVPANMFKSNTYLKKVTFSENVGKIGNDAFNGCTGITGSITIPASITSVGNYAFRNCTGITEVYWNPPAVAAVGADSYPIFSGCKNISKFVFAENVTIAPRNILRGAGASLGDFVLPEGLKQIGNDAFRENKMTSVNIPDSVTSVGNYAFYKCTSLATVYWNAPSIASVGTTSYPIFGSCSALVNFIIGENVTVLPQYLLRGCTGIASIVIPDSVVTIGAQAFYNCSALTSVQIGETADCAITTIGTNAFYTSALTEIIIYAATDSVTGSPWGASSATITWAA